MIRMRGLTCLLSLSAPAWASSSAPWGMAFDNDGTGPDGPWAYVIAPVDAPSQTLGFYPSMIEMPMMVNASACQSQSAQCVMPTVAAWTGSAAHDLYLNETSAEFDPSEWEDVHGGYVTDLMSLQGSMRYTTQRLTLGSYDLDGLAMSVADNLTASFPNGDWYTVAIGYLSLYGGSTFTYDIPSGTRTLPLQLASGWSNGAYASMSFGLHMGSVMHKISGKLFWGGYDRARCISEPITVDSNSTFSLADISIGVASGGSAFLNNTSSATDIDGLLQTNTSTSLPLTAQPDPGVPYLYLPGATCDAIAGYLPVTYDAGLALYRWNTSAPEYDDIVSSPHHLSFHFHTSGTSGTTQSIAIPFALLNLTLDYPITSDPTPYFPCRPYDPSSDSSSDVVLGRAFLQGAHFAQNWHTGSVWLAQAPGPGYVDEDLKTIQQSDTGLTPLPNAQAWNETWADVLTPLNGTTTGGSTSGGGTGSGADSDSGSSSSSSSSSSGGSSDDSGLSSGAKAGIGVGVAVGGIALLGLAGAALVLMRRRKGGADGGRDPKPGATELPEAEHSMGYSAVPPQELEGAEMQELPADNTIKELQGHQKPHELPARYA